MSKPTVSELLRYIAEQNGKRNYVELFEDIENDKDRAGMIGSFFSLVKAIVDGNNTDQSVEELGTRVTAHLTEAGFSFTAASTATIEAAIADIAAVVGKDEDEDDETRTFENVPENISDFLGELIEDRFWTFGGINPEARTATFLDTKDKERIVTWDENGVFAGFQEGTSLDLGDIARTNLLGLQADQLRVLLDPELIPINDIEDFDGRAFIKGTGTIVDLRKGGEFIDVENAPGVLYDPVTGQFINTNGDVLARDKFEYEQQVTERDQAEQTRQFDVGTEQTGQFQAGELQTGLQGLLDERAVSSAEIPLRGTESGGALAADLLKTMDARGIATAQATADPGRFIEAERLRRGLQPEETQEVPLFGSTEQLEGIIKTLLATKAPTFGDTNELKDIIDLILTTTEEGGKAPAVPPVAATPPKTPPKDDVPDPLEELRKQYPGVDDSILLRLLPGYEQPEPNQNAIDAARLAALMANGMSEEDARQLLGLFEPYVAPAPGAAPGAPGAPGAAGTTGETPYPYPGASTRLRPRPDGDNVSTYSPRSGRMIDESLFGQAGTVAPTSTTIPPSAKSIIQQAAKQIVDDRFVIPESDVPTELLGLAGGGTAVDEPVSIVGDPQQGNQANPELLINHGDGTFDVVPLNQLKGFAKGTEERQIPKEGRTPREPPRIPNPGGLPIGPDAYLAGFERGLSGRSSAPGRGGGTFIKEAFKSLGGLQLDYREEDSRPLTVDQANNSYEGYRRSLLGKPVTSDEVQFANDYARGLQQGLTAHRNERWGRMSPTSVHYKPNTSEIRGNPLESYPYNRFPQDETEEIKQDKKYYDFHAKVAEEMDVEWERQKRKKFDAEWLAEREKGGTPRDKDDPYEGANWGPWFEVQDESGRLYRDPLYDQPPLSELSRYVADIPKIEGFAHGTKRGKKEGKKKGLPHYSHGTIADTSARVNAQGIPTVSVSPDVAIQKTPGLEFLKGNLSSADFNTLGQKPVAAAFGAHLPDAGSFNLNKLQDILNDPRTLELLETLYRSGSRDFQAEISRARQRAPIGTARETSVIRG